MKKFLVLLLCIMLCVFAATACAAPKRTDINLSITAALQSADPHGIRNLEDLYVRYQIYEGLYYFDEAHKALIPRLAESYTVSSDGLIYTFKLRKDVKFHNGDPLKASDVVFSIKRCMTVPYYGAYTKTISDIKAVDDNTVDIILKAPSAPLINCLSNLLIASERAITEQGGKVGTQILQAGTGPYRFKYLDQDQQIVLEAFPEYYRGEAAIKKITFRPIKDQTAASLALEAGELNWYAAPASTYETLKNNPKFNKQVMSVNHITYLCINYLASDILNNDKVRQAIAYAVDREAINLAVFNGLATEAYFMETPLYNVGAPSKGFTYTYNPEKAKQLLKEAGYEDGVNIGKILVPANNYQRKCAEVLQSSLDEVGITATMDPVETATALVRARKWDYDICVIGYANAGDFDAFRLRAHSDSVGMSFIKMKSEKFNYKHIDELFDKGVRELDTEKRVAIYEELNNMVAKYAVLVPLLNKAQMYVWNANLNVVNAPNFYQVYDWSWKE